MNYSIITVYSDVIGNESYEYGNFSLKDNILIIQIAVKSYKYNIGNYSDETYLLRDDQVKKFPEEVILNHMIKKIK